MTAYFTDPMAEEFRKAIEEALKDSELISEDPDSVKRSKKPKEMKKRSIRKKRDSRQQYSRKVRKSMK
jgi:hypothetical protein